LQIGDSNVYRHPKIQRRSKSGHVNFKRRAELASVRAYEEMTRSCPDPGPGAIMEAEEIGKTKK